MSSIGARPLVIDTKASQIRQRLSEAIINGELRPGDRIVLDELARELGVSKIPLREALSSLEGAGLVVTTPHAGPRVAPLPTHEIRGIYLVREQLEPLAARLAAEHANDELIDELHDLNDRMRRRAGRASDVEMSGLNSGFHLAIARATTFQTVVESVDELITKIRRYRSIAEGAPADWDGAIAEHEEIISALADADAERAAAAMRAHVHARRLIEPTAEAGDGHA
ncbi:GntR family transcriptional regulator [Agromyces sp. SYSU T00266]|uniref:GntR family transcriptional regulator n=1 Tax=Agromyces zhanjiangensis TaxID=3158562 RepID=UPI0033916657